MKRAEAISYFQRKLEENAMDADTHHNLAVLYKSMGDAVMYARHSRIALLTKTAGPKAYNESGIVFLEQGKLEEAKQTFEHVISTWPTFPCAYANMAAVLARTGKYVEALPFCDKALSFRPNDASLHRNLAKIYENLGRTAEALQSYQRALALAPDDAAIAKRISLLSLSRQASNVTAVSTSYYNHYRTLKGEHFDLKL